MAISFKISESQVDTFRRAMPKALPYSLRHRELTFDPKNYNDIVDALDSFNKAKCKVKNKNLDHMTDILNTQELIGKFRQVSVNFDLEIKNVSESSETVITDPNMGDSDEEERPTLGEEWFNAATRVNDTEEQEQDDNGTSGD